MSCTKCAKKIEYCGCKKEPKTCGCTVKTDAKCVFYNSDSELIPMGVIKGDNLDGILKVINDMFCDINLRLEQSFIGANVGSGFEIYKGQNLDGIHEFKTLIGGEGIVLTETSNGIEVKGDAMFIDKHLKEFVNDLWFKNHLKTLIKQDWFVDYLQTIMQHSWFGDLLKYWIKQDWFRDYVEQILREPWFTRLLSELTRQQWFIEVLKDLLNQTWFSEILASLLRESWFKDHLKSLFSQRWFKDIINAIIREYGDVGNVDKNSIRPIVQELLREDWFIALLKDIFGARAFRVFVADYIKGLVDDGLLDICALIAKCTPVTPPTPKPVNQPPRMTDVSFNVPNRAINFAVTGGVVTSKYSDPENDPMESLKIVGGDVTNITKANGTPLQIGDIIPVSEIGGLKFNGRDVDNGYTQIVDVVAVNNIGQESN